jgi:hypothetical protein
MIQHGTLLNREGMTWNEWAAAAALPMHRVYDREFSIGEGWPPRFYRKQRKAWRAGEDPTEWRAA